LQAEWRKAEVVTGYQRKSKRQRETEAGRDSPIGRQRKAESVTGRQRQIVKG
jgi:hypothetical protein